MMTNIVNTNMNSLLTMGLVCDNGWDKFVDLELGNNTGGVIRIDKGSLNFWGEKNSNNVLSEIDESWLDEGWMSEGVFGSSYNSCNNRGRFVNSGKSSKCNKKIPDAGPLGINWITKAFYYGYNVFDWIISGK